MKLVGRKLVVSVALLIISAGAYSAEGYKNLTFGMSINDVKKNDPCKLDAGVVAKDNSSLKTYTCYDFKFGGKSTMAFFYFIDQKLQRIGIVAGEGINDMLSVGSALKGKYGYPTSPLTNQQIQNYDSGTVDQVTVGYDKDTVLLRLFKSNYKHNVLLIYTHDQFDNMIVNSKKRGIAADI